MKLCFIENRYQTWMWQSIAKQLQLEGHEIHWLILNPIFKPNCGSYHYLPLSKSKESNLSIIEEFPLLKTDRAVRYFGMHSTSYESFRIFIRKFLETVQPDFVFGEQTQFYELLTCFESRRLNIPFLVPSSTRYPPERMLFHLYDSLETIGGEGVGLTKEKALQIREQIVQGSVEISYMKKIKTSKHKQSIKKLLDRLRITTGWLLGERFITPSPWRKYLLEGKQKKLIAEFEKYSEKELPKELHNTPWVLYALQMQPESNIDVWGYPWNDQTAIIREAADALYLAGFKLVVKPNPKSKYEINEGLCELLRSHPGIVSLKHGCSMREIFPHATAVLSVTGTVQLEAVLAGKPVGVLGSHALRRQTGITGLEKPADIVTLVQDAFKGQAKVATPTQSAHMLSRIYSASYDAAMYDPQTSTSAENLYKMVDAFRDVITMKDITQTTTPYA